MSTYNEKESDLRASIDSILNQTYKNLEFIIVLDNPDNSSILDILKEYERVDRRVKVIINEINIGLAPSLNKGISIAKGRYVARMDADDISFPDRLEKQLNYIEEKDYDLVATNKIEIDENGKVISKKPLFAMNPENVKKILPYNCFITHPSVLIKKEVLENLHGYRDVPSAEDYDLWLRMIQNGYKLGILNEYLIYYRIRMDSISRKDLCKQLLISKYLKIAYRKNEINDESIITSIEKYLKENNYYSVQYRDKFNKAYHVFGNGLEKIYNKKFLSGIYLLIKSAFTNIKCLMIMLDVLKYKLLLNYEGKKH
ncbi:glycosyltransferase [Bacillus sp. MCCB 382]|uniref:glycosyltransferase n=1 Tax=Bacillus sp. MCCB 382 TaxID=2860197 RepID=UPI001C59667D|nr:glycosyltransferase [Bacillus sp. MCCB 382]